MPRVSTTSLLAIIAGAVAAAIAFTGLSWVDGDPSIDFAQLRPITKALEQSGAGEGFSTFYFAGGARIFIIVTVVLALLACLATGLARWIGIVSLMAGVAGAGATLGSLAGQDGSLSLGHAGVGLKVAAVAFLLVGVAGFFGSRFLVQQHTEDDLQPADFAAPTLPTSPRPVDGMGPPSLAVSSTPAGWWPDPRGRHEQRYWTGSEWTQHVQDHGIPAVDPV